MGLSVVSNPFSLNAQRNLAKSASMLGKSLERLSSGLRINRASDDAAGLAISEGLRSQIRGLNQAVRNANDGISLLSTAEGAADESTSILQRLRELAVQSASDTNSTSNRSAIDKEVQQLLSELDRISATVEFNGTKLLDGSFTAKKIHVGAFANQTVSISLTAINTTVLGQVVEAKHTGATVGTADLTADQLSINGTAVGGTDGTIASGESIAQGSSARNKATAINTAATGVLATAQSTVYTATEGATAALDFSGAQSGNITINGVTIDLNGQNYTADSGGRTLLTNTINAQAAATGVLASVNGSGELVLTASDGRNVIVTTTGGDGSDNGTGEALGLVADGGGTEEDNVAALTTRSNIVITSEANFTIVTGGTSATDAGITATTYATTSSGSLLGLNVLTQTSSNSAITSVDAALRQISDARSDIGALTNRLESTVRSLSSISENLSASDSRIRDADFAVETANLTKAQILQQAGIAILGQANALPQFALSLLG